MIGQPWICIRCNKVKAPHVEECACIGALEPWVPTQPIVLSIWTDCGCPVGRCERTVCPRRPMPERWTTIFTTYGPPVVETS